MSKAPRFTLADLSRKSPAIQAQVQKALYGAQATTKRPIPAAVAGRIAPKPTPAPPKGRQRVVKSRNAGQWTEARYWQAVRSALRRGFRFWGPAKAALMAARVAAPGPRGRKWLFLCAGCGKLFLRRQVQIDHVVPCGQLTCLEHIPGFLARLTPEDPAAYAVRCTHCHQRKTDGERQAR
jgi:5-methylcytosine-specific restriction endonuclease McrA